MKGKVKRKIMFRHQSCCCQCRNLARFSAASKASICFWWTTMDLFQIGLLLADAFFSLKRAILLNFHSNLSYSKRVSLGQRITGASFLCQTSIHRRRQGEGIKMDNKSFLDGTIPIESTHELRRLFLAFINH